MWARISIRTQAWDKDCKAVKIRTMLRKLWWIDARFRLQCSWWIYARFRLQCSSSYGEFLHGFVCKVHHAMVNLCTVRNNTSNRYELSANVHGHGFDCNIHGPGPPNWGPEAKKNIAYKRRRYAIFLPEKYTNLVTKWFTRLPHGSKRRALGSQIGAPKRRKT